MLVTLAQSGVAGAASPDRAPSQGGATAGTSPAPDPAPLPVRVLPTHHSAPPIAVTPVSRAPATTIHSTPTTSATHPVTERASNVVEPTQPTQATQRTRASARKRHPPIARPPHRLTGPVSLSLALPRIALPNLLEPGRASEPNGVLLLLSSLSLGLLVIASLTLLRRLKRLNGGWWT